MSQYVSTNGGLSRWDQVFVSINGKSYRKDQLKADLSKYYWELAYYREFLAEPDLAEEQKERFSRMISRLESFINIIETMG